MKQASGTVVVGFAAVLLLIYEWDYGRRTRAGRAVVVESDVYGRSGLTIADAIVVSEGRRRKATLRAWYCVLRPGLEVRVRYLPGDPGNLVLDWFWQRHYGSVIGLAAFTALATTQTLGFLAWRRRQASVLLRDDDIGPPVPGRGTPVLPIDLAPRLWDRDLDGSP